MLEPIVMMLMAPPWNGVVSTSCDRANDDDDPNRPSSPIPGDVLGPSPNDCRTASRRDAIRDARRNHPSHDDTRRRVPKPELPRGIPLSPHSRHARNFIALPHSYGLHDFVEVTHTNALGISSDSRSLRALPICFRPTSFNQASAEPALNIAAQ
jgi:hypothetical protein